MNCKKLIIEELLKSEKNSDSLALIKRKIAKLTKQNCPNNIELLKAYHELVKNKRIEEDKKIEQLLRTRPVRSLSGVVNVSILSKPYKCPGECIYCPKEENIPKSYLSGEPAVERAKRLKFNPYIQTKKRIEVLEDSGHIADKIDLRVIGGTWSTYSEKYKVWFVLNCFRACNNEKEIKKYCSLKELWSLLGKTQKKNQQAKHRIIGLSFETRPDAINQKESYLMRRLGATKIEIGVQSIYDDVLTINKRGHLIKKTIEATRLLKNNGFKVSYQVMLNLPGSTPKKDLEMFKEIFNNKNFKPDYLKIYPCALVKSADLYNLYLEKKYKPYTKKVLVKLIKDIKKIVPYYVRIERIIRDIPAPLIVAGPAKISNLRQEIEREIKKENWSCKCIRCREIKTGEIKNEKMFREDYYASEGKEIFLSFESKDRKSLYAILRLRIKNDSAIIREVHTYGPAVKISTEGNVQHKGLGKKLIKEAENIAKDEYKIRKLYVISGVGVREYYKKLGYNLKDYYMFKSLY